MNRVPATDGGLEAAARAAQAGDDAARGRLLGALRPTVYRWCLVGTLSADDAEDLTQQVLLRVHARLGEFAFASRLTTWVYSITRSTIADARRTQRRRVALLAANPPVERHAVQAHDDDALERLVRAQLGTLPARQRAVFDLVELQGHSPAEAAALLDMNPTTLRVHLLRARRALRTRILAAVPALAEDLHD